MEWIGARYAMSSGLNLVGAACGGAGTCGSQSQTTDMVGVRVKF